ncbi:general secretion pathway protein G [Oxalobacteraceae bacterium GrIS 1.18]
MIMAKAPNIYPKNATQRNLTGGFTLIELLVVLAIVALLLSVAVPKYFHSLDYSKETILKDNLRVIRKTIDQYYVDAGHYPDGLEELVAKKYLRSMPIDPITESSATWVLVEPNDIKTGKLYDLHSGAQGAGRDGIPYGQL